LFLCFFTSGYPLKLHSIFFATILDIGYLYGF
jgi:hypothetical protein